LSLAPHRATPGGAAGVTAAYYVYTPPPVIVQEPPAYAQVAPAPAPAPQAYWYYCPSAGAYYPTTPTCPEAWVQVPPRSE